MVTGPRGGRGKRRACHPDGAYAPLEYSTIRTLYLADPTYWVGVMQRAAVDSPMLLRLAGATRAMLPGGNAIARRALQELWRLPWEVSFRQAAHTQDVGDVSLQAVPPAVDSPAVIITVAGCAAVAADWAPMLCWFESGVHDLVDPAVRLGQALDETNVDRRERLQARLRRCHQALELPLGLRHRGDVDSWLEGLRGRRDPALHARGQVAFDVLDFLRSVLTRLARNGPTVRACDPFRCSACDGLYLVHPGWSRTKTCSRECDEILHYRKLQKV